MSEMHIKDEKHNNHGELDKETTHPRRKRDKDNPYKLSRNNQGQAFISFTDGERNRQCLEIDNELYDLFDSFELEDKSYLNEVDRYIEKYELPDGEIDARAFNKQLSINEEVERNLRNQELYKAIQMLPETQRRRLCLFYFVRLNYKQIAEIEGCKYQSIQRSVAKA